MELMQTYVKMQYKLAQEKKVKIDLLADLENIDSLKGSTYDISDV